MQPRIASSALTGARASKPRCVKNRWKPIVVPNAQRTYMPDEEREVDPVEVEAPEETHREDEPERRHDDRDEGHDLADPARARPDGSDGRSSAQECGESRAVDVHVRCRQSAWVWRRQGAYSSLWNGLERLSLWPITFASEIR